MGDRWEDLILGQDNLEMEAIEQSLPWDGPIIRYNLIRRKSIPRLAGEALLIVLCMPVICLWIIYELQIGDRILVLRSWFRELEEQAEYIRDQERMYLEWEKDYYQRVELGVVPPPADGSTLASMQQKREAEKREKSKFIVSTILILIMFVSVQIIGVIVC